MHLVLGPVSGHFLSSLRSPHNLQKWPRTPAFFLFAPIVSSVLRSMPDEPQIPPSFFIYTNDNANFLNGHIGPVVFDECIQGHPCPNGRGVKLRRRIIIVQEISFTVFAVVEVQRQIRDLCLHRYHCPLVDRHRHPPL